MRIWLAIVVCILSVSVAYAQFNGCRLGLCLGGIGGGYGVSGGFNGGGGGGGGGGACTAPNGTMNFSLCNIAITAAVMP